MSEFGPGTVASTGGDYRAAMADVPVVIIGAGLAGLIAARRLVERGVPPGDVLIVDKGRGIGGRMATRRIDGATLDHGAQFFTVRSDDFAADVTGWVESGAVVEWCRGFATVDGYPRYRGATGMTALPRHLAAELTGAGVTIATATRVASITADGDRWILDYTTATGGAATSGPAIRPADRAGTILVTAPIPQTLELVATAEDALDGSTRDDLAAMAFHKVLALLTVLDRSPELPEPGALQQPADPTFSFVADNQAKGISAEPAVTFHTAHGLSAELWDAPDDEIIASLRPRAAALVAPASIVGLQLHRWGYSGPVAAHPDPFVTLAPPRDGRGPLMVAGDGFGGSKVEGAYTSGRSAGEAMAVGLVGG